MSRHRRGLGWLVKFSVVAVALLMMAPSLTKAQSFGYGWSYGYPGYASMGYGYPGYGYGGYGYPGYGYGGYGYGGFGFGYGYPGFAYGYSSAGYGIGYPGFVHGYGASGYYPYGTAFPYGFSASYANPLFGLGLSPLGVQSALAERNLLGRGLARSTSRPVIVAPSDGSRVEGSANRR
jgi:hypothetical protein